MIDLPASQLQIVKKILLTFAPDYEVWVFGSRITGNAKKYSDLDLAIISNSPLPPHFMGKLKDAFSESDLPFKVDIVDWASTAPNFRKIIKEKHELLHSKKG